VKKRKNKNDEQPWTLAYPWALSLKLFFWSGLIGFPFKMMPCRQSHNLICLGLGPSSKDLETNLKILTNKNAQFHWNLLFGPFSKVTLLRLSKLLAELFHERVHSNVCKGENFASWRMFFKNWINCDFHDFFAIFRDKNVKLATSRHSHFLSHRLQQNFCKNATADLRQLPFHAN
jgi:hypothetical protein